MKAPPPTLLLLLVTTLPCAELAAQVLLSNPITGTNPNTSNPYTTGQTIASHLTTTGIARGSSITGTNANDRFTASGWNSAALDGNDYFTWTLTPAAGYALSLTSFTYTGQASGTGPSSFALRTSADTFGSSLGTPAATGGTITLTSGSFQGLTSAVEFRLYGWNASSAGGTFSVNDFTFNGTVSAIPEPSTYAALAGVAALGLALRHRRQRQRTPAEATFTR